MQQFSGKTETYTAQREWSVDGVPVLSAALSLPRPAENATRAARRIGRFYRLQERAYLRYCEHWLFPRAAAEYRQALEAGASLPSFTAELSYRVTCCQGGVLSLWTESRERAGGHTERMRRGDTWDLRTGTPLPLGTFFPARTPVRRVLTAQAEAEIRRQLGDGSSCYREDWRKLLRRRFSRENFFVTPQGVVLFYQMYAIAPAAEGIPCFCLPFGTEGCGLPAWAAAPEDPSGTPA